MIPPHFVFDTALSLATEDYFGLYEVVWELNGKYEDALPAERLAAAQAGLRRLVGEGLIAVYRTHWMRAEHIEVAASATDAILADPASWASPAESPDGSYYCFTSTPRGDTRYFGGPEVGSPAG